MNKVDLTNRKFSLSRSGIRKEIINLFLEEEPGTGKGETASKYEYIVKRKGIHEVYIKRPAQFNNGFDFTLNVSNINFNPSGKATTRPTHENIIDDLSEKKAANADLYEQLYSQIELIYNCKEPNNTNFNFGVGIDSEILLECIKWLFVEQDVTYWNYSGRAMFMDGIPKSDE